MSIVSEVHIIYLTSVGIYFCEVITVYLYTYIHIYPLIFKNKTVVFCAVTINARYTISHQKCSPKGA